MRSECQQFIEIFLISTENNSISSSQVTAYSLFNISNLDVIRNTLDKDIIKLEWHSNIVLIDFLSMKYEFRDEDSLESQSEKDEEWQEGDLN